MIINNKYKLVKPIGRGGMGEVYYAHDIVNNKDVAFKKLIAEIGKIHSEDKNIKRWKSEIATMTKILHKNIVQIHDYKFGPTENDYYIVMEYVKGKDLDKIIRERVYLDQKEAVYYIQQILEAINFMNKKDILHRDLKPANILVKDSGEIKLCDLGLAKFKNFNLNNTSTTAVVGTRYYMAPEVLSNYKASVQSEIYSVGVILFELLTGSKPYKEDDLINNQPDAVADVNYKIKNAPLPSVKNVAKAIPQALENVVIKATAKLPSQRYQSYKEFQNDLSTVFLESRQFEQKLKVATKFIGTINKESKYNVNDEEKTFKLPLHTKAFVCILIVMIGVVIYYAR